jgi:hypothetical protein
MGELFLYSKLYFYKFQCLNVTKTAWKSYLVDKI